MLKSLGNYLLARATSTQEANAELLQLANGQLATRPSSAAQPWKTLCDLSRILD
jgi:hypothetical protein